jgi:hypothetical protein
MKITRILLYYFKVNALRNKINQTQNALNQRRAVLLNELQHRYVLNLIIIVSYLVDIVLLESITDRWQIVVGCIIYFIIDNGSVSLAQSITDQIDDISFCNFLLLLKGLFIGLIIVIIIILVVPALFPFFFL